MTTAGWVTGRCYYQVGRWYCHGSIIYFILSSEMLNRTSSQMCGRWYLPIFLFRDGLLTLIYRASLIVLIRFWSSLPTSDLRKPCLITGKSLFLYTIFYSVPEEYLVRCITIMEFQYFQDSIFSGSMVFQKFHIFCKYRIPEVHSSSNSINMEFWISVMPKLHWFPEFCYAYYRIILMQLHYFLNGINFSLAAVQFPYANEKLSV